ncbi:unnamed protein product [Ophioblennius macclurei]
MGFLKQIDLENFKSWRGKQVIGPFMRFNCIIGTNGSGKSNLMDALSFVMGERPAALRVKQLSDLINGAHVGRPVSSTARVSMWYCDDEGRETEFSRSISGDSSEYRINDARVTFSVYSEELRKIGIITKTQNCFVFQGAVESIALKDPKERTKMFEYISQSKDYAAEYNMKKEALQKAKQDSQFHFMKKKSASVEKKLASQEKLEADRYQLLVDELNKDRLQLSLAELYTNQQSIDTLRETLTERQRTSAAKMEELESWERTVASHKREQGRLTRELQCMEKEIRSQEHVLSQSRSQYIKVKVNTTHHKKKAEEAQSALKKTQRQLAMREKELEEGREEVAELERTWKTYERQVLEEQVAQRRDVELTEDQSERYQELKELARKQGAVLNQQAEKRHWEVQSDHEKIAFDQRRKKEVQAAIKNCQSQLEDVTSRAEKLQEYSITCRSSLDEHGQQEERLSAELERGRQRCHQVNQELGQVIEELGNAGLASQESKRQLQRNELLEKLRRLFPQDVYCRLFDLCSPIHKKYQLAITKVFSRYISAIVVSTEKVARDCIAFMKEERAEPETFLPIDFLAVSPLNERLRELRSAKMAVDVVQVNTGGEQMRKVVQFVCGNALVCENIQEARRVAFDGPERHKTVALDGTMFSKSGVISGGSSDLRTKARCWDEKEVIVLRERKEQLSNELRDLVRLRRKESDLNHVTAQIQGVQTRLRYSGAELENLLKKIIPRHQAEILRLQSELVNLESHIQMQQELVEAKEAEMNAMRQQVQQVEDSVFSDFCAEIGVNSISEYEQQHHLKCGAELDLKRLEFQSHFTRLNAKLEYDQEQLEQQKKTLQKIKESIKREEKSTAEQRKEEEKLLKAVEEAEDKLQQLKSHLTSKKSQVEAGKAELGQEVQRLQGINKELAKLQQEVMSAENALEQKYLARHNMLLACKVQGLPIRLLSGSLRDISEIQLETDSESTAATMYIYERESQLVVDFSAIESQLGRQMSDEQMNAYMKQLRESISSTDSVLLQTTAPDLKALEKMTELKEKLVEAREAFDASTIAARKCSQEFNLVKTMRFDLFSQCFEHVSVVIDQIYKRICRNNSAQAILSTENPEEPYLDGIRYVCVAPGKRYMSMDNLSGGEKAIAALAMIFAIHSFRPTPFFVLDEVDASLDNSNIGKVIHFIREECGSNMQIIAISLKGEFYSRSDALQGVYSDFDSYMFSRILTLDLRPYPRKEESWGESSADGPPESEVEP